MAELETVHVSVLGPIGATKTQRPISLTPKAKVLLGLLVLSDRNVATKAELLASMTEMSEGNLDAQGGEDPRIADASFRNFMTQLRRDLGHDAIPSPKQGQFMLNRDVVTVDVWEFEAIVARAREAAAAKSLPRARQLFEQALDRWTGHSPYAVNIKASDTLPSRFVGQIRRLNELRAAVEEELVDALLDLGLHLQAIERLVFMVESEPHRQRHHMQYALALHRAHRQADALDALQKARRSLADVGLLVGRELVSLETKISNLDPALDWSGTHVRVEAGIPRAFSSAASGFVGRQQLRHELAEGLGRVHVIVGGPGMGKTALLGQLLHDLTERGTFDTICCICEEHDQQPLAAFVRALNIHDHKHESTRMSDVVYSAIAERARSGPTLLLVDDLHVADLETERIISRLAAGEGLHRLAVFATADGSTPCVERLVRNPAIVFSDLVPLTVAEVGQIIRVADHDNETASVELHRSSGGVPALLKILMDSEGASSGRPSTLPRHATSSLLLRLAPRSAQLLEVCALLADDASPELVMEICHFDSTDLLDAVTDCEAVGLLAEGASLRFRSRLLRQHVVDAIPLSRSTPLHAAIARSTHAPEWVRARHALRAIPVVLAADALDLSGRGRLAARTHRRFADLTDIALGELSLRSSLGPVSPDDEVRLLLEAVHGSERSGRGHGEPLRQRACDVAQRANRFDLAAEALLLPTPLGRTARVGSTLSNLFSAIALAGDSSDQETLARLRAERITIAGIQGAHRLLPRGELRWAKSFGLESEGEANIEALRAYLSATPADSDVLERAGLADRLAYATRNINESGSDIRSDAVGLSVRSALELGDINEVLRRTSAVRSTWESMRPVDRWARHVTESCIDALRGDLAGAAMNATNGGVIGSEFGVADAEPTWRIQLLNLSHHGGDHPELGMAINFFADYEEKLNSLDPPPGPNNVSAVGFALASLTMAKLGNIGGFEHMATECLGALDRSALDFMLMPAVTWLAQAYWEAQRQAPQQIRETLEGFSGFHIIAGLTPGVSLGPAERYLAQMDSFVLDPPQIIERFAPVLVQCWRQRQVLFLAATLGDLATALERRDADAGRFRRWEQSVRDRFVRR